MVARAKPQQRRRAVLEMRQHQLAHDPVAERQGSARLGVDQLGVEETAGAEVHPVLVLALAPQRDADVADPIASVTRAPALFEPGAEAGLATAGLPRDQHPPHARVPQVDVALAGPLDQIRGVGGREHRGLRAQALDGEHPAFGVAGADRNVTGADAIERGQRGAGHERSSVVGGDDALPGPDPRGGVAAR